QVHNKIYEIRGIKVMLDFDLAGLYEVETKVLNQSVKRNIKRFPPDFMFQLTKDELESLKSQFVTSNKLNSLHIETSSEKRGGNRRLPYAFTEQGLAMLSGILNSEKAINVNIAIMRAFVYLKQFALTNKELTDKLKKLESKTNKKFKDVYDALDYLLQKDKLESEQKTRVRIGFKRTGES
ncbi:MAG TPA: ORF6N domain-containing protein, partial [Chitinophagales bacterium]|nr:ORF6N domain-containing protein [Chitinophagales bacterium]